MARLLLIDDDPGFTQAMSRVLSQHGHEVLVCQESEQALACVERDRPHLILLDVMMPGLNGYEVCQQIRRSKNAQRVPIIFLSAFTDDDSGLYGLMQGADDYLRKPFKTEELLMRITILLEDYER